MENENALASQSPEVKLKAKTPNEIKLKNKLQQKKHKKLKDVNTSGATELQQARVSQRYE